MADTPILSLLSTPQVSSVPSGNATQGGSTSGVIPSLPPGTVISGFILSRDARGNPILRTDKGDVLIQSDQFLKIGSEVTARVENQGGNIRTRILTVDGFPLGQQPQQGAVEDEVFIQNTQRRGNQVLPDSPQSTLAREAFASADPSRPQQDRLLLRAIVVLPAPTAQDVVENLPSQIQKPSAPLQPGALFSARLVTAEFPLPQQPESAAAAILRGSEPPRTAGSSAPLPQAPSAALPGAAAPSSPTTSVTVQTPTLPQQTASVQPGTPLTASPASSTAAATLQTTITATPVPPSAVPALPQITQGLTPSAPLPATTATATPTTSALKAETSAPLPPTATSATLQTAPSVQAPALPGVVNVPPQPLTSNMLSAPAASANMGPTIPATVVGMESGELVLNSTLGTLKIPGMADFPPGTRLTLEMVALQNPMQPSASGPAGALPSQLAAASEMAHSWQALSHVISSLARVDYGAAQQLLQNVVPQLGPRLASGMLFFISAVRGGDFRGWIGQKNIDLLEQSGNGDVVRKAMTEFGLLRNNFLEQQPGNWQMLFVPMAHGEELHQARLFVKKDGQKEKRDRGKQDGNTRFVLEVELSEFGEFQMDGFVRIQEQKVGFDLFIRTHEALPQDMQAEIIAIYNEAAQLTGFNGQLIFQATPQFPVNPLEEIVAQHHKQIIA